MGETTLVLPTDVFDDNSMVCKLLDTDEAVIVPNDDFLWSGNMPNRCVYYALEYRPMDGVMFLGPRGTRTVQKLSSNKTLSGMLFAPSRKVPYVSGKTIDIRRSDIIKYIKGSKGILDTQDIKTHMGKHKSCILDDRTAIQKIGYRTAGGYEYRVLRDSLIHGQYTALPIAIKNALEIINGD